MRSRLLRQAFFVLVAAAASTPAFAGKGGGPGQPDHDHDGNCGHHDHCRDVQGPFTSTLVPPPTCTSPVGLCTHGILHGDLEATYDFTFATLVPADDPAHPGRMIYTGTSIITPTDKPNVVGQMFSDDDGFLDPSPDGTANFETTVHVDRGTKLEKHTDGTLVASGVLNFATGEAVGSYIGELCRRFHWQ
jgi:hypothetical protein